MTLSVVGQPYDSCYKNLVKRYLFEKQNRYYPLTVEICPYGFWYVSDIYLGFGEGPIREYLRHASFGWNVNGVAIETPHEYFYDTINIDTLKSKLNPVHCIQNTHNMRELQLKSLKRDTLINISDHYSFAELLMEFKYSFVLRNINVNSKNEELIHILYPTIIEPYKTSFDLVTLRVFTDHIGLSSTSINTTNLLKIEMIENGNAILIGKEYRRLNKIINKCSFEKTIDCNKCYHQPFEQFAFILNYQNKAVHSSYFLCEGIRGENKDMKKSTDIFLGLKHLIVSLNEKYFY